MTNSFQVNDDLTLVRGNHQLASARTSRTGRGLSDVGARSAATGTSPASMTGLGLADFLLGRVGTTRSRRACRRADGPVVPGRVRPGHVASDEPGDGQRGPPVGAVLQPEPDTGANTIFNRDNFRQNVEEHGVPQRAGRASSIPATRVSRPARRA